MGLLPKVAYSPSLIIVAEFKNDAYHRMNKFQNKTYSGLMICIGYNWNCIIRCE